MSWKKSLCRLSFIAAFLCSAALSWGAVNLSGLYHNNTNQVSTDELIPDGVDPFLNINYGNGTVTFAILTAHPAGDDDPNVNVRVWSTKEDWVGATWQMNFDLTATNQFHGTPIAGTNTVEIWKAVWTPPRGWTGTVYYAPQVYGTNSHKYLVRIGATNDWVTDPQATADDYSGVDYSFNWTNAIPANYDWFYYNNLTYTNPAAEAVPGLGGSKFFDYSYDVSQPCRMYLLAPPGGLTSLVTRFWFTRAGNSNEVFRKGDWLTNVVIDSAAKFHSLPATGAITVEVWRTEFYPPNGCNAMYYAPQIFTPDSAIWLSAVLTNGVTATNNWTPPQYFSTEFPGGGRDWGFLPTQKVVRANSLNKDWAYMNNTNLNPQTEAIPTNAIVGGFMGGKFLEVNYARTTTTFYVMTDKPLNLVPDEIPRIQARISFNATGAWDTVYMPGNWVANLLLSDADQFHGLPVTGSHTVDLWKVDWPQPVNAGGTPITNEFTVYFSFLLETCVDLGYSWVTEGQYLVGKGDGNFTNNYLVNPQFFNVDQFNRDFSYLHKWYVVPTEGTNIASFTVSALSGARVSIMSDSGFTYHMQYTTKLEPANTVWTPVFTTNGTGGLIYLLDTNITDRTRAYRIAHE